MTPSTTQADTLLLGEVIKAECARVIADLRFTGPGVMATREIECSCEGVAIVIQVKGFCDG